ncbi:hypothetical protein OAK06_00140 [Gammaproteobacteria bacterium]|nr:hypothetical protein [Gammaproteobacteria bacterium]
MKKIEQPPREKQIAVFCNLYDAFKLIDLDWKSKYAGFERILFDSELVDHWIITSITHDALTYIAGNGFSKKNTGIVRGHNIDRKVRAENMFTNTFDSSQDVFDYFMEHDKVTLITKNENGIKKGPSDWSTIYQLDKNLFPYRCGYAATYTDEALDYFKKLAKEVNITQK